MLSDRILIFGGTTEGRKMAEYLADYSAEIHVCVATDYGEKVLEHRDEIHIHTGRLDKPAMEEFIRDLNPVLVIDATHPYAEIVSANIEEVCEKLNVISYKMRRGGDGSSFGQENSLGDKSSLLNEVSAEEDGRIIDVASVDEAVSFLDGTEGNILITTGSKEITKYREISDYENRCYARVLDNEKVVKECEEKGFVGAHLITGKGPFSLSDNINLIKETGAKWLVTKNSGKAGGFGEKIEACRLCGITPVVVKRPDDKSKRKLAFIGMGPGDPALIPKEGVEILKQADLLIGAGRILDIWREAAVLGDETDCLRNADLKRQGGIKSQEFFESYKPMEIIEYLISHPEHEKVAICYSGNIEFFSGAFNMEKYIHECEDLEADSITKVAGMSSVDYLLEKIGMNPENVYKDSCHGREIDVAELVKQHKNVCLLIGKEEQPSDIAEILNGNGYENATIWVGSRLSYPDEEILEGKPSDFVGKRCDKLSVMVISTEQD